MAMFHRSILIESVDIDSIKNATKTKSFFWVRSEHGVEADAAHQSANRAVKIREIVQMSGKFFAAAAGRAQGNGIAGRSLAIMPMACS
jgi:hypothetical protein